MGEPRTDVCVVRRMVQFLPATHDAQDDACCCGGTGQRTVDSGAVASCVGAGDGHVMPSGRDNPNPEMRFRHEYECPWTTFSAVAPSSHAVFLGGDNCCSSNLRVRGR